MNTIGHILETKGSSVFTTTAAATIDDAVVEMCRRKVGALLVVDAAGKPKGMLSERDLLTRVLLAHLDPATTKVGEVMTPRVLSVDEHDTVTEAMALMTRARCRHLPVIIGDAVVGMVSIGDLVRATSYDQERELRELHNYVEGRYPI